MTPKDYANLHAAISAWMDDACCGDNWPNVIVGDKTVDYMARAAANVLDATEEAQDYALAEGLLKVV